MPRVNLNTTQREVRKFSDYVRGQLSRTKTKQSELADFVGISQQGLSMRILGKVDWKLNEVIDIISFFEDFYVIGDRK